MGQFCTQRYFERLPGFVDVNVLSMDRGQTLLEKDYPFAVPFCRCQPVPEMEMCILLSLVEARDRDQTQKSEYHLKMLLSLIEEYEKNQAEISKDLDKMSHIFAELQSLE